MSKSPAQNRIAWAMQRGKRYATAEEYFATLKTEHRTSDLGLAVLCEMIEAAAEPEKKGRTKAMLEELESARISGDWAEVFRIGMLFGRLETLVMYKSLWEGPWRSATKALRGLREAAAEAGRPPAEIATALRLYDERMLALPDGKKTAAQRWVREQTGIPESVLRYHLAKRRKKNL